jgi:hypothetical protein
MELVLKDLPQAYERKIKAIHILSEGKINLSDLLSQAVCAALDAALLAECGVQIPAAVAPVRGMHAPQMAVPAWRANDKEVPDYSTSLEDDTLATLRTTDDMSSDDGEESDEFEDSDSTFDGLGDEAEFEDPPEAAKAAQSVEDGPNPPEDEDDALFGNGDPVNGPSDPAFDDLTAIPDDLEDDDSLYADASASYNRKPEPKAQPKYAQPSVLPENVGLKDLGSDASSMGFFDAILGGGNAPAYAKADQQSRRAAVAQDDGMRRPASLPAGEAVGPSSMGRRPRVKVSGAK